MVRNVYMSDYGIGGKELEYLLRYCKSSTGEQQTLILAAAQKSNQALAVVIFFNLITGTGYNQISAWYDIPINRNDFYGYRRRTLAILNGLLKAQSAHALNG